MKIWVDNDATPRQVREIVVKASRSRKVQVVMVSNSYVKPLGGLIEVVQVGGGMDEADDYIVEQTQKHDLIITQDIPLADRVVEKGALAISPRGVIFDKETIKDKLAMRDLAHELRSAGTVTGGPPSIQKNDIKAFADGFDRLLTKCLNLTKKKSL